MKTIALKRLNLLSFPKGNDLSTQQKVDLLTELATLGYRISNPEALDAVTLLSPATHKSLMEELQTKRGGNVPHIPLFKNFPTAIPQDTPYFLKRVMGYLGNTLEIFKDGVKLANGTVVPQWLFDVYEFGADPITQMQSADLFRLAIKEEAAKLGDSHVEWHDLTIVGEEEADQALQTYMQRLLYSKSSIKTELHDEVCQLLQYFGADAIDPDLIVFKETRALVLQHYWKTHNYSAISTIAHTATDLLRMFASITGTDVSLATNIRFPKMKRSARKAVLQVLEQSYSLPEDLKKYRGLWLEIGRYLHPMEYAKRFPRTAAAFDALRNGTIETFASVTERYLAMQELDDLLQHLETKPGVYARKLHEVLRKFPSDTDKILKSFERNIVQLPIKNVLVLKRYFETINEAQYRTVINKKGKIKILPNNAMYELDTKTITRVVALTERILLHSLTAKETWQDQRVWIDPALKNFTVPLQQRKVADGMITVGRGSRIDVDFDKVLRLFVYWKEATKRTDLDLSVMQLDKDFKYIGHVSYTNLQTEGIVHSGDIQSAPHGAAEFVDITLNHLQSATAYLAVQVYKYAGDNFRDMDCHAGWMIRDKVSANIKTFDIKTVANKFDLSGTGAYAFPLVVDLRKQQIIMTDLFVSGRAFHNRLEGAHGNIALICSQISNFVKTRPTMEELSAYHALARRATLVATKEEADITFGYSECTYNASDVELILSELL